MSVKLRAIGEAEELEHLLALLSTVLDVAYDGRTYPCRGGFGVRAYFEVRTPPELEGHGRSPA